MVILSPAERFRKSLKAFQKDALQELIDSGALTAEEKEIALNVQTKREYNKRIRRNQYMPKPPKCYCYRCEHKWHPQRRNRATGRVLPISCPNCGRHDWNSKEALYEIKN